jgi:hypothetical protein
MRALNQAASSNHMRIARLPSSTDAVRFRVISPEKRSVSISEEAKRARVEKSLATRAARRAERELLAAMGMPPEDSVEAEDRAQPSGAAAAAADASPPAASPRRHRRSSGLSHY